MRERKRALKIRWSVDLPALRRELKAGSLAVADRKFIERMLPGFCDFAEGKIDRWPPTAPSQPATPIVTTETEETQP